jgi:AraC-like DNA-binding protein
MDRLSTLLSHYTFSASIFYNGEFCGENDFSSDNQLGQLHLVRQGPVSMRHEDQATIELDRPCLVFYPRGLRHRLTTSAGHAARLLCANITFEGGQKSLLAKALPESLVMYLSDLDTMKPTLEMLFNEAALERSGQKLAMDRLCDLLIVQVLRHACKVGLLQMPVLAGFADPSLSHALVAMHDEPGKPWTVDKLAGLCNMSRSKFAKQFHDVVGETPANYLTERRMMCAQKLMRSHIPIKAVAKKVGYATQPSFTKAFTVRFGCSPMAWLKSIHV